MHSTLPLFFDSTGFSALEQEYVANHAACGIELKKSAKRDTHKAPLSSKAKQRASKCDVPPKPTSAVPPHSDVPPNPKKVKEQSSKSFRLNARNCFLTFPQIPDDVPLGDVRDKLITAEQSKGLVYACIARELHQEGTPHYHLLLHYNLKRNLKDNTYFNFLFNKQGNYTPVRDFRASLTYVKKYNCFLE